MKLYIINQLYTTLFSVIIFAAYVSSISISMYSIDGKTYLNSKYELVFGGQDSLIVDGIRYPGLKSYRMLTADELLKIQKEQEIRDIQIEKENRKRNEKMEREQKQLEARLEKEQIERDTKLEKQQKKLEARLEKQQKELEARLKKEQIERDTMLEKQQKKLEARLKKEQIERDTMLEKQQKELNARLEKQQKQLNARLEKQQIQREKQFQMQGAERMMMLRNPAQRARRSPRTPQYKMETVRPSSRRQLSGVNINNRPCKQRIEDQVFEPERQERSVPNNTKILQPSRARGSRKYV